MMKRIMQDRYGRRIYNGFYLVSTAGQMYKVTTDPRPMGDRDSYVAVQKVALLDGTVMLEDGLRFTQSAFCVALTRDEALALIEQRGALLDFDAVADNNLERQMEEAHEDE